MCSATGGLKICFYLYFLLGCVCAPRVEGRTTTQASRPEGFLGVYLPVSTTHLACRRLGLDAQYASGFHMCLEVTATALSHCVGQAGVEASQGCVLPWMWLAGRPEALISGN